MLLSEYAPQFAVQFGGKIHLPVEASTRFELVHDGFANRSLTAWVRRLIKTPNSIIEWGFSERKIGFEPTTLTLATLCSTS